jgi:hypothetical protein
VSLGSTIIASGMLRKPANPANDPLAPIRRMSQAEKIAFFSLSSGSAASSSTSAVARKPLVATANGNEGDRNHVQREHANLTCSEISH